MRKLKLFRKIIAFILVVACLFTNNMTSAFAQEDERITEEAVVEESVEENSDIISDTEIVKTDVSSDEETSLKVEDNVDEKAADTKIDDVQTTSTDKVVANISDNINLSASNKETVTSRYFDANFFDYDRDEMNQIVMDMVAKKIMEDDWDHELTKDELAKNYPALLFTTSTDPGKTYGEYSYVRKNIEIKGRKAGAYNFMHTTYCPYNVNNLGRGLKNIANYQGLVEDELDSKGLPQIKALSADLFNTKITSNKKVYKNSPVEFKIENGYYVLDSSKYKYTLNNGVVSGVSNTGSEFLPLGDGNFHFGMSLDVDFVYPKDGLVDGEQCVFKFSGDDDVWVYIDNKLVLDIGGIHGVCSGEINFATGKVTYKNPTNIHDAGAVENLTVNLKDNTRHTLKVFYLERGASKSNCKITFKLPTLHEDAKGDLAFKKTDSVTGQPLSGAEFDLYNYNNHKKGSKVGMTVKSNENGIVSFEDLDAGLYLLEESKVPAGYKESTAYKYIVAVTCNPDGTVSTTIDAIDYKENNLERDNKGNYIIKNELNDIYKAIDKKAILADWRARTYDISLYANAYRPIVEGDVLDEKADKSKYNVVGGSVTDIVDKRFELTQKGIDTLTKSKATIHKNEDGTTTITWNNIDSLFNWNITFEVKAKDKYVGGNYISTNDSKSGVLFDGDKAVTLFPEPKVNVRIEVPTGKEEDTIFLGQTLEKYFYNEELGIDKLYTLFNPNDGRDYCDAKLSYSWDVDGKEVVGELEDFRTYIMSQAPEVETKYVLKVHVTPNTADESKKALETAEAMKGKHSALYTATMNDSKDSKKKAVTEEAIYLVHILTGQINVAKQYDHSFLTGLIYSKKDIEAIDAKQTAIFKVSRYAEDASVSDILNGLEPIETYNITITGNGSQSIKGLRAGMYRVEEVSSWTWKYNANLFEENDENSKDGVFYIGKESPKVDAVEKNTVSFENCIDREKKKIYSDTTNILNKFIGSN